MTKGGKKHIKGLFAVLAFLITLKAGAVSKDTVVFVKDDPIVAMLDSLNTLLTTGHIVITQEGKFPPGYNADFVPDFPDSVYDGRLKMLDKDSPFDLVYNPHVRDYINLYAFKRRKLVARMLGMTQMYFPLFEEMLDKYNLPLELKYLAIVESALNPNAVSRVGAAGLWQFMYATGKLYQLQVTSYVDDRRDPIKATDAACRYLRDLYKMYGDWQIVLAAYNSGPGNINKAIRRSGGKRTYWEIRPFLPRETQNYVPAFIAVNYTMHYAKEHNLYPVNVQPHLYLTDTLKVKEPVRFDQIAGVIGVSREELQFLNPSYKLGILPGREGHNTLRLPAARVGDFLNNENTIYAFNRPPEPVNMYVSREYKKIHTVKKGEKLYGIAKKYNCTVDELMAWNNLKAKTVKPGKKLAIYINESERPALAAKPIPGAKKDAKQSGDSLAAANAGGKDSLAIAAKPEKAEPKKTAAAKKQGVKYIYHTVQPGDTLWRIANKHKVEVEDIKKLNNIRDSRSLKVGAKIKVAVQG